MKHVFMTLNTIDSLLTFTEMPSNFMKKKKNDWYLKFVDLMSPLNQSIDILDNLLDVSNFE